MCVHVSPPGQPCGTGDVFLRTFFFLNIRESSYKNKTLFLDSACRITPQIHSLRDTNSSDQRKNFFSFFPCFRFFLLNIYLKKEELYFFCILAPRDLYTIFFLTKSAKKVRLLFLRGLGARRGFFEEMDLRLKYHHCTSPGASLARAPAGPTCTMPDSSMQGSIHSTFHPFRRSAQKGTRMQFFTHIRTHDSIFFCEANKLI